ncbi:MAG: shikimate kinase [Clostridia bacterium]|nr:shikimate kinase [Clostridia bacterium]
MRAGLLGRKLGHSFSPRIHSFFGDYSYGLFEVEPEELDSFMKSASFDALNVTIPYKRDVIPYCAELTESARGIGSVNTIVRRPDGSLLGDNTDAAGFRAMLDKLSVDPAGKKALVLGSGGASLTACHVLRSMGASEVIVISRSGENNYENLPIHADAHILVNTTPVGMYPHTGKSPVNLDLLPRLQCVLDVVYNPSRTQLILDAEARGIPCLSGLTMLVEQARAASECFTGASIPKEKSAEVLRILQGETLNLVLIGMPGSGKSTIGQLLAEKTGRKLVDADTALVEKIGMSIPEYFASHSEEEFRAVETEVLSELGKQSGLVIATGGGCITRERNKNLLHQNGAIFFIQRDISLLPTDGRPISQANPLEKLYEVRLPLYRAFADAEIDNNGAPEHTAAQIMEVFYEISDH